MPNLSLNELKQIAKMRRIKGYKSMYKERLLSALDESETAGSRNNFNNARKKQIREDFNKLRDRFLKPKIKKIRRNLCVIENKKNLSNSKIRKIENESKGDKDKNLSPEEYFDMIRPYLNFNFIPTKDSGETRTTHTKSRNIEIMMGSETNDIIEELHKVLLRNYQKGEESMRGSEFVRDSIDSLYYHLPKISLKRGRSYIDSPKCLKIKKQNKSKKY